MPTKKKRVTIYLEDEHAEALKEWAENKRRTINSLIALILEVAITDKSVKEKIDKTF